MTLDVTAETADGAGATFDDLFRRAGVRNPDGLALADPPDRTRFTDGAPRRLTFAEADRAISALAIRLRGLGLGAGAVVAVQVPNIVEGVLTLMGALRAGMIPAPLPLLWGGKDIADALRASGAKAIVTCLRAGGLSPVQAAMQAAAEVFAIRNIVCFGGDLPEGVVPFDDIFEQAATDRQGTGAPHVAAITFDVDAAGIIAVQRSHLQLISGGLAPFLESRLAPHGVVLSTIPPSSFAGIALTVVPWLLAGGALVLHQDCDAAVLATQAAELKDATLVLPGPAVAPLSEAGTIGETVRNVVSLWRAPERMAKAETWCGKGGLVDVAAFGEIGLIAAPRDANGMPSAIPHGVVASPRGTAEAVNLIETARSKAGTLLLRGPMVPAPAYPSGDTPDTEASGFVDTGYACRVDGGALTLTRPPTDIATIGFYRFPRRQLEALASHSQATIMTVPDALLGERLVGDAPDREAMHADLQAGGVNPLLSEAFLPRRRVDAA